MKIVFFNRFFYPDTSATSQILSDLALELAKTREVHVVTSRVPGGMADVESVHAVTVHRVATAVSGPHGLARRGLAYFTYFLGARSWVRELVGPGDIVIVKTDPPMLSAVIGPLVKARGARLVLWLQDLFPEIAVEFGVPGMRGPAGNWLAARRNRSSARADAVVVIGERMAARLSAATLVERDRLYVIPNWFDGSALVPDDEGPVRQKRAWGLHDRFVVGYSGNLGRVHEFDTLLGAASRLRQEAGIVFLIIGRGPRVAEVVARVAQEGLPNVRFEGHQPRESLQATLGVPDVHLSILPARFEGLVMPSKLYGIMAVGKPTIFIGDAHGETGTVLRENQAGITVPTGADQALADAILALRADPHRVQELGANARSAFTHLYDMPVALAKWRAMLAEVEGRPPKT